MLKKQTVYLISFIFTVCVVAGYLSISFCQSHLISDLQRNSFWYCRSSRYAIIAKAHFDDDFVNLAYEEQQQGFRYQDFDVVRYHIGGFPDRNLVYFRWPLSRGLLKFKVLKLNASFKLLPENSLTRKTAGVIVLYK